MTVFHSKSARHRGLLTVKSRHPEVTLFGADLRGCPGTRAEAADLGPGVSGCRPPGLLWGGTPLAAADRPAQIGARRRRPNAAPPTQCPPPPSDSDVRPQRKGAAEAPQPPNRPTDVHGSGQARASGTTLRCGRHSCAQTIAPCSVAQ